MAASVDDVDLERDRHLVLRAQAGDDLAFASLYDRYHQRLIRFAVRRVGNRADAEEIAQEAFTRAYRALPDFGAERRFYSWLSVITARLCIDALRRGWRCEVGVIEEEPFIDTAFERIEREDDVARINQAMDRLNPRHREVLHLREREGWAYQRIADHYQVSLGTVEALLWRARRSLKREYETLGTALLGVPLLRRLWSFRGSNPMGSMATISALGTATVLGLAAPMATATQTPTPPLTEYVVSAAAAAPVTSLLTLPPSTIAGAAVTLPNVPATVTKSVQQVETDVKGTIGPIDWDQGPKGVANTESQQIVLNLGIAVIGISPANAVPDLNQKLVDPLTHASLLPGSTR